MNKKKSNIKKAFKLSDLKDGSRIGENDKGIYIKLPKKYDHKEKLINFLEKKAEWIRSGKKEIKVKIDDKIVEAYDETDLKLMIILLKCNCLRKFYFWLSDAIDYLFNPDPVISKAVFISKCIR